MRLLVFGLAAACIYLALRPREDGQGGYLGDLESDALPQPITFLENVINRATETPANVSDYTAQTNVAAFLAMIRASEGTDRASDPYRVVMGYGHTLQDLSDHPYFTGEWKGATFGNPPQLSTAAGAYQFLRRTWAGLREKLRLPDFGPASQDAAAIELIRQRGALEDVKAGRFAAAVEKCRREWASLPGAGYGQHERTLVYLQQVYANNGGVTA